MDALTVKKFVSLLVEKNILVQDKSTFFEKSASLKELFDLLEREVKIDQEAFARAKAEFFHMPYVDLVGKEIPQATLNLIPQELSATYHVVAFEFVGNRLDVALTDPTNLKAQEVVQFLAREHTWTVVYHIASRAGFDGAVKQYSELGVEVREALDVAQDQFSEALKKEPKREGTADGSEVIHAAPISKMIRVIFKHAVDARASDIHIEPKTDETRVRYRIDGVLYTALAVPKYLHAALVSRVKVLSNLKIDETRVPQDGRINLKVDEKEVNFRVSTFPLYDSEKVVLRILDTSSAQITLESLGFWGNNLRIIKESITKPHGMFLVTGPTGSGKSTTIHAGLQILNDEGVNIVTLEDPVEYFIQGVNQAQVNPDIGFTFAAGLRSILRQDPDIIQVGEIRDNETAELAIHAALTGHMVLSTLHTNDAFGAIPRLVDMHVEPFLIASSVNAVLAQRLVRAICRHCKVAENPPSEVKDELEAELKTIPKDILPKEIHTDNIQLFRGKGCPRCENTGYSGRQAICEILEITDPVRQLIIRNASPEEFKKEFLNQGMLSLKQDGVIKVLQGVTTLEEVLTKSKS